MCCFSFSTSSSTRVVIVENFCHGHIVENRIVEGRHSSIIISLRVIGRGDYLPRLFIYFIHRHGFAAPSVPLHILDMYRWSR